MAESLLPDADRKIVFDQFHRARHLGEAVDLVPRRETASCAPKVTSG
jgi:hypothetical protein